MGIREEDGLMLELFDLNTGASSLIYLYLPHYFRPYSSHPPHLSFRRTVQRELVGNSTTALSMTEGSAEGGKTNGRLIVAGFG